MSLYTMQEAVWPLLRLGKLAKVRTSALRRGAHHLVPVVREGPSRLLLKVWLLVVLGACLPRLDFSRPGLLEWQHEP
jgi:hypothetical protein